MIKIRPQDLEKVLAILKRYVPEAEVWAYGSRVDGSSHQTSDLDLVLRDRDDLSRPQPDLAALQAAFSESNLPILVDVNDWARVPEGFRREMEACHHILR